MSISNEKTQQLVNNLLQKIDNNLTDSANYYNLALLYQTSLNQPNKSEEYYKLAIKYKKNYPEAYFNLAYLYDEFFQNPQKSEENYNLAIHYKNDYHEAYFNLAFLQENQLNQPKNAEQNYIQAIKYKNDHHPAYKHLGQLYQTKLKQPKKAEENYLQAIKIKTDYHQAYNNLANLYQNQLKQPHKAETNYLLALKYKKDYPLVYKNLGLLYQNQLQSPQKAEECYISAIKYQSTYFDAYFNLANLYFQVLNQPLKAEQNYNLALKYKKDSYSAYNNLALLQSLSLNQPLKAEKNFQLAIKYKNDYYLAYNCLGLLYENPFHNYKKSIHYYEKAIQLHPQMYKEKHTLTIDKLKKIITFQNDDMCSVFIKQQDYYNKYKQLEFIKEGQFSKIFKVQNTKNEKIFALKQLNFNSQQEIEQYIKEITNSLLIQTRFTNAFLIKIYNIVQTHLINSIYIITELAENSLHDIIQMQEQPIQPQKIYKMIKNLITGLQQLQFQNLIHRDIKPENILYMKEQKTFKFNDLGRIKTINTFINNNDQNINSNNDKKQMVIKGNNDYFSPQLFEKTKDQQIVLQENEFKEINWEQNDIFSTGLSIFSAVCLIKDISIFRKNLSQIEQELKLKEKENIYSPIVFEIIRGMISQDIQKQLQIDDLFNLANKLA